MIYIIWKGEPGPKGTKGASCVITAGPPGQAGDKGDKGDRGLFSYIQHNNVFCKWIVSIKC